MTSHDPASAKCHYCFITSGASVTATRTPVTNTMGQAAPVKITPRPPPV